MFKYFVVITFYFMLYQAKSLLEYGEFDVNVTKMEDCKGPKRKNCVEIKTKIVNHTILDIDVNVKEDMKTFKGKIIGIVNNKVLLRIQLKNVCDHIFLGPLIQSLFNNTDHCGIDKGRYRLNADIPTINRNFFGGKFIYGNWKFSWKFYNDFCNLQCADLYMSLTPKEIAVGDKQ